MAVQDSQYIPNDITFLLDYEPNPGVIDIRGELTGRLGKLFEFPDWKINQDTVQAFDAAQVNTVLVGYNRCGLARSDCLDISEFQAKCHRLLDALSKFDAFGKGANVKRLGVRARFCTKYSGTFDKLLGHIRTRLYDIKPGGLDALGPNFTITDVGAPIYFKSADGTVHLQCGAVKQDEVLAKHFKRRKPGDIPAVGFFFDFDYFLSQADPKDVFMQWSEVAEKVRLFSLTAWNSHEKIRRIVVA